MNICYGYLLTMNVLYNASENIKFGYHIINDTGNKISKTIHNHQQVILHEGSSNMDINSMADPTVKLIHFLHPKKGDEGTMSVYIMTGLMTGDLRNLVSKCQEEDIVNSLWQRLCFKY